VQLGRQIFKQEDQGLVNGFRFDQMVIIQNKDDFLGDGSQIVDQGDQNGVGGWRLRGLEHVQGPLADFSVNLLDLVKRCDEVDQESHRIVIIFIQREPGHLDRLAMDFLVYPQIFQPMTDQGGFAKASRGGDQSQFAVQTILQAFDQFSSLDEFRSGGGDVEFCDQNRGNHAPIIS
jgi:hypothetical protein